MQNRLNFGSCERRESLKLASLMAVEYECCSSGFFIHILVIVFLVLFAGLMSGLTLGLMSMSLVDLEVLAKSGKPQDRKHAGTILLLALSACEIDTFLCSVSLL